MLQRIAAKTISEIKDFVVRRAVLQSRFRLRRIAGAGSPLVSDVEINVLEQQEAELRDVVR